ncbi:MAG: hypothetical protein NXI08_07315 [bacterium]|nr:hypothetical protein [bacterium]
MTELTHNQQLIVNVKRMLSRIKRLIPYPILKYGDVLIQSLNPVFWIRAIQAAEEFIHLMRRQRVEITDYQDKHGLSAIMYFSGDISIYIHHQKMEDLNSDIVEKFTSELRKKSHTITRLPSVFLAWLGQLVGLAGYFNWPKIEATAIHLIDIIRSFIA